MCRDILNTCVRNTEDAEKATTNGSSGDAIPGRKASVWGMIEESELAKTIRGGFDKVRCCRFVLQGSLMLSFQPPSSISEEDALVAQVRQVISDLEDLALRSPSGSSVQPTPGDTDPEITRRANTLKPKLQRLIERSLGDDSAKVDELLALNDSLTSILASPGGALTSVIPPISRRISKDKGIGLTVNIPSHESFIFPHTTPATSTPNGHVHESPSVIDDADEELLSTPRLDKGKQRAEEEPERPTQVLRRPSLVLDEDDEFVEPEVHPELGVSPTVDRSVIGNLLILVLHLDVDPNILTGLVAGSKKKGRSSVKAQSSLAPRRWRESMLGKSCERRLASGSQPKLRSNLLTVFF